MVWASQDLISRWERARCSVARRCIAVPRSAQRWCRRLTRRRFRHHLPRDNLHAGCGEWKRQRVLYSIGYDTSLNPSGIDPILRASDGTMLGGHSPTSTPSGGDGDEVWSCTGRTDTSPACSSASLYFLEASYGGGAFVEGIEILGGLPTVVAPFNNGSSWPTPAFRYHLSVTTIQLFHGGKRRVAALLESTKPSGPGTGR